MGKKKKAEKPTSILDWGDGNIVKKSGSERLYYDFMYLGERVEISTGLKDTPENRRKALSWLFCQREKMKSGEFKFSEAFPQASPKKKALFAAKEGGAVTSKPQHVRFGDYVEVWYQEVWSHCDSGSKKIDQKSAIDHWITPFFGNKTFFEINTNTVGDFIRTMKQKDGKNKGKQLSRKRIANVLLPLRAIWKDACEKFRWELPDPFRKVPAQMPKEEAVDECVDDDGNVPEKVVGARDPLRFNDFMAYLEQIDPWYRPVAELWMLTGLIPSEMAGITPFHIKDGYLYIRRSISRGVERKQGKTKYRRREIRITAAIRKVLDIFIARLGDGRRLITLKGGQPLTSTEFNHAWVRAEKKAGLTHRVPYVLRHSFAAWSLTIGIDPNRLVSLMGHGSKQMVYEVYGNYVEGLEKDREKILDYFGRDFVEAELKKAA
ncbi:putative lambdoid prophage Rac integrase [Geobacter sp. OR-1]|uniref:tyrosine-type recombinase/integrase n=1 Tax=Geobacter sp. OR-1 TaxID=1266765 RepID=UPI0005434E88|nr:tyrosine-type recombinase/integrase [Geobacter sp. OR-1]GAM11349.1 putative lambdoid prophage Rac integrase [Geobacter sp. OR-1]